ncbi:hypothetical protein ACTMTJ_09505 [Phytohabitans sp. LJ34]|uniref:hypothetical protein n=1 Tax=Phytohabitans sp. LJ34 TaxID=3452217 RepID=UPI003F8CA244
MKSVTIIVLGIASLLGVGAIALSGVITRSGDTHPPCDQLPTVAVASERLAKNQDLANEIESLGNGVAVEVGKPCAAGQDRALISVAYETGSEREAISDLLTHRDGFGVPVHLVKR